MTPTLGRSVVAPVWNLGRGAWLAAVTVMLAACTSAPAPRIDVAVVPTNDGGGYYLFRDGAVDLKDAVTGKVTHTFATARPGLPTAQAWNGGELSAVAYPGAIAVVASGVVEPQWRTLSKDFAPSSVAVTNGLCALVEPPATVWMLDLLSQTGREWHGAIPGVDVVHHAMPTQDGKGLVVVASQGHKVVLRRVDTTRGDPTSQGETVVPGINEFGGAAAAGEALIVAGLWRSSAPGSLVMSEDFKLVRVDPETMTCDRAVGFANTTGEMQVVDIAVGQEMVALYLWYFDRDREGSERNELCVYELKPGRHPADWNFKQAIQRGSRITRLGTAEIGVIEPGMPGEYALRVVQPPQP